MSIEIENLMQSIDAIKKNISGIEIRIGKLEKPERTDKLKRLDIRLFRQEAKMKAMEKELNRKLLCTHEANILDHPNKKLIILDLKFKYLRKTASCKATAHLSLDECPPDKREDKDRLVYEQEFNFILKHQYLNPYETVVELLKNDGIHAFFNHKNHLQWYIDKEQFNDVFGEVI